MRRLAKALVGDAHRAEDLAQDAWVAALEGGREPVSRRGWLATVLARRASTERRARGRRADRERRAARPEGGSGADQDGVDEAVARVELQERLAREVFALEEPYRQVVALRFFQGWPPRRIARELGLDVRAVETRLRRGVERLRERLDAAHEGKREEWLGGMAAVALGGGGAKLAPIGAGLATLALAAWAGFGPLRAATTEQRERPSPVTLASVETAEIGLAAPVEEREQAVATPIEAGRRSAELSAPLELVARVRLLRAGDLEPMAGVVVEQGGEAWTADEHGVATVPWPEARVFQVQQTPMTPFFGVQIDGPGDHERIVPQRGGTLRGTVVDLDGDPVPLAEVRLFRDRNQAAPWELPAAVVQADAAGRFEFTNLADFHGGSTHLYRVLAWTQSQFSALEVDGRLGGEDVVETVIVVEPAELLEGHVAAWDAEHLRHATVTAYPRNLESYEQATELFHELGLGRKLWGELDRFPSLAFATERDGRFRLPLPATTRHVQVDHRDYPQWRAFVEPGEFVEVWLGEGSLLSGRVVGPDGAPVEGAVVKIMAHEQRPPTGTDAEGSFEFEALTPQDGLILTVIAEGLAGSVSAVDLRPGHNEVAVRLEPEFRVEGRLVDASGAPVPSVQLEIVGERLVESSWFPRHRGATWQDLSSWLPGWGNGLVPASHAWTDAEGRFEFGGLHAGRFHVESDSHAQRTWARVPADGGPFTVVLGETGGAASVRCVLDPWPAHPEQAAVTLQPYVEGEDQPATWRGPVQAELVDGAFEARGLTPGRWQVVALAPEGVHTGSVLELGPGLHVLDVPLEPTGR